MLCWSFSVILAWDNQKGTFLTHFFNFGHEGAPNVTKLTYNMKILWENSHRKKNWGSFVHRGLRYDFLRKKIWTVPLILQFNIFIFVCSYKTRLEMVSSVQNMERTIYKFESISQMKLFRSLQVWCWKTRRRRGNLFSSE